MLLPSTWIILILCWAWKTKKAKRKKYLYSFSILLFFIFSNRFITDEFARVFEPNPINIKEINTSYEAVVILGGYTTFDSKNNLIGFHESVDRILYGIYFYKQRLAKKIIVSGGNARLIKDKEEALVTKEYLLSIGIPENDILIETHSKNTHENAINVASLLKENRMNGKILLLTSAYHMPRSEKCFQKQQIVFDAFPVDFIAGPRKYYFDHLFLPNMEGFIIWETLIHEWVGLLSYQLLGYV
ncbi:MAG: YdcF family protein [Bacteroidetes bacterium]|nr:hypothetical protein [Flavobacteriales bacterium]NOG94452.1 YdcF family protein [Bacteroidota bacterium]CAG0978627.1 hypothetical protein FLAV_01643 [Flavobacteriales bacterium]